MGFTGFPSEAFDFYARLQLDNSRTFWQANKPVYDTAVRGSLLAALDELHEYGPFQVFRPHRDVRFSKDKTPYKENAGGYGEAEGGTGYYLALDANGLFAGAGYYQFASDQMERFREAVAADGTGSELAGLAAELEKKGYRLGSISELKTAPRGYPKDHPRIELLRRKGLFVGMEWPLAKWMHGKAAIAKIRGVWEAARPVTDWLDTQVGPSTLPPEELRR
ncbi:MAG TPA: TIGR02453 family protein [Acidimicrobiaceae bacterium]|nr:TIGR02453 family protein [Acidimicrobiaceae bacterium]